MPVAVAGDAIACVHVIAVAVKGRFSAFISDSGGRLYPLGTIKALLAAGAERSRKQRGKQQAHTTNAEPVPVRAAVSDRACALPSAAERKQKKRPGRFHRRRAEHERTRQHRKDPRAEQRHEQREISPPEREREAHE